MKNYGLKKVHCRRLRWSAESHVAPVCLRAAWPQATTVLLDSLMIVLFFFFNIILAIWFLPTYSVYGSNPRSGEIDLLEMHGNENWFCKDGQDGTYRMVSTLHWGYDSSHDMFKKKLDPAYTPSNRTCWKKNSERSLSSEFHIYAMEWSPDGFRFFLDDQQIGWMLPPPGGFAELAELNDTTNIWAKADDVKMAPFDQPVSGCIIN